MKILKFLAVVLCISLLAGCYTPGGDGKRLNATAPPIQNLAIQIYAGDLEQAKDLLPSDIAAYRTSYMRAFYAHFSETFKINGVSVPAFEVYGGTIKPKPFPESFNTSHRLVIVLNKIYYMKRGGQMSSAPNTEYDARLIDNATQQVVWTGTTYMQIRAPAANLSVQFLAAALINGLAADKFISLKTPSAVNARGDVIKNSSRFATDG